MESAPYLELIRYLGDIDLVPMVADTGRDRVQVWAGLTAESHQREGHFSIRYCGWRVHAVATVNQSPTPDGFGAWTFSRHPQVTAEEFQASIPARRAVPAPPDGSAAW